jgi:RHS repeat-associated protein
LAIIDRAGHEPVTLLPTYDGNGNIVAISNGADTSLAATYDFDAFGKRMTYTNHAAQGMRDQVLVGAVERNEWGFSTKAKDGVTSIIYYGYRYYDPNQGRWVSRDPIQEIKGGINLYAFIQNDGRNRLDVLGLKLWAKLMNPNYLYGGEDAYIEMDPQWSCDKNGNINLDSFTSNAKGPITKAGVRSASFNSGNSAWASVQANWEYNADMFDDVLTGSGVGALAGTAIGGVLGAPTGPGILVTAGTGATIGAVVGAVGGAVSSWDKTEWNASMMLKQKAKCVCVDSDEKYIVELAKPEFYGSSWFEDGSSGQWQTSK